MSRLHVVKTGHARVLNGSPCWGIVAPLRSVLRGDRGTPRAEVAGVAAPGWGRVARPGAVEAGRAVGAVGGISRAGKVVVRALRARLLVRRSDRTVTSGCLCVVHTMRIEERAKKPRAGGQTGDIMRLQTNISLCAERSA